MADVGEIKLLIKSILASSPTQLTQRELLKQFRSMVGYNLPFQKFGCSNCEEFLRSISDTCVLNGTGPNAFVTPILTSDSVHIVDMIEKQRLNKNAARRCKNTAIIVPGSAHTPTTARGRPNGTQHSGQGLLPSPIHSTPMVPQLIPPMFNGPPPHYIFGPNQYYNNNLGHRVPPLFNRWPLSTPRWNNGQQPWPLQSQQFRHKQNHTSRKTTQPRTPTLAPANNNALSKPSQLETTNLQCATNGTNGNEVGASFALESSLTTHSLMDTTNYRVPYEVQNNLRMLMRQFPDGLWLRHLPEEYRAAFKCKLEFSKYGYISLAQMCVSLKQIFRPRHLQIKGGKLYDASTEASEEELLDLPEQKQSTPELSIPFVKAIPDCIVESESTEYPPFVMLPGDIIPIEKMPSVEEQRYPLVFVSEVYDPSKFWFCLADNEQHFGRLVVEMKAFYIDDHAKYAIKRQQMVKGLFVVLFKAPHAYHRAVVVKFTDSMVKVFCVDNGTVEETVLSDIYFMCRQFGYVPRQAMRGRLARLMPPMKHAQWSCNAAHRFLELVRDRRLHGSIDYIDNTQNDPVYHLVLCDTTHAEDIYIHDMLVAEQFAIAANKEQRMSSEPLYGAYEPIVSDLYQYPLFIELELARLPTASEMRSLAAMRVPLYDIYPQYFKRRAESACANDTVSPQRKFTQRMQLLNVERPRACSTPLEASMLGPSADEEAWTLNADEPSMISDDAGALSQRSDAERSSDATRDIMDQSTLSAAGSAASVMSVGGGESRRSLLHSPAGYGKPQISVPPFQQSCTQASTVAFEASMKWNAHDTLTYALKMEAGVGTQRNRSYGQSDGDYSYDAKPAHVQDVGFRTLTDNNAIATHNLPPQQQQPQLFLAKDLYPNDMQPNLQPRMPFPCFRQHSANNSAIHMPCVAQTNAECRNTINHSRSVQLPIVSPTSAILQATEQLTKLPAHGAKERELKKVHVLTTTFLDKSIHIVRIMRQPCVVTSEIQRVFTGKNDPLLLRRYLFLSDVVLAEIRVDAMDEALRWELSANNLLTDGHAMQYTSLDNLKELILCITNDEPEMPNIAELVYYFADNSPVWNAER